MVPLVAGATDGVDGAVGAGVGDDGSAPTVVASPGGADVVETPGVDVTGVGAVVVEAPLLVEGAETFTRATAGIVLSSAA